MPPTQYTTLLQQISPTARTYAEIDNEERTLIYDGIALMPELLQR